MTVTLFSQLTDGQTLAFDPENDVLIIDTATAADTLIFDNPDLSTTINAGGVTIRIVGGIGGFTSDNITFADLSAFVIGDNTTGLALDDVSNTFDFGTDFNINTESSQYIGLGGNDDVDFANGSNLAYGNTGRDTFDGGTGIDILYGGQ
ncbi:MAG: hypothetical protein KI792_00005, partial [Alphaproteobacteria bacterium]|nr:hypothetical protein [Alphaproteobacteria bacterium SS10]